MLLKQRQKRVTGPPLKRLQFRRAGRLLRKVRQLQRRNWPAVALTSSLRNMMEVRSDLDTGRLAHIDGNTLNWMARAFHGHLQEYAEAVGLPMTYDSDGLELVELTGRGQSPPCTAEEYDNYKKQVMGIKEHPEYYQDGGESALYGLAQIIEAYEKYERALKGSPRSRMRWFLQRAMEWSGR